MNNPATSLQRIAKPIGLLSLVGTILPPTLFMFHLMDAVPMQWIMLVSCLLWFAAAPLWMKGE